MGVDLAHMIGQRRIKLEKRNIILGDSNTRNGIDDKIFTDFKNFSQGGESYLFAYTKLDLFLKENNKIDTILLAFAPHNLISNKWVNGTEAGNLRYRMVEYFPYYTSEQHKELFTGNPKSYISSWQYMWESWKGKKFNPEQCTNLFFLGGFLPNNKIQNDKNFTPKEYEPAEITPIEVKYLNKIIALCRANGITLIFIATPKNYLRKDFKNYYRPEFYEYYHNHYSDIPYLDFYSLPMPKDSYADISHLSYIGGEYFSKFLKNNGIQNLIKNPQYNKQLK